MTGHLATEHLVTHEISGVEAIVVGASAGAIEALSAILPSLPRDYPLPLIVVVHLPRDKRSALAELFKERCRLEVKEAEDKETIRAGTVYFAPPDYHLLVEPDRRLSLSSDEPVLYSRPSIDVLFETAADAYGERLLGIILTGASSDGAAGLRKVCEAGGKALVERPDRAQVSMMPEAALAACPHARAMELGQISALLRTVMSGTRT